MPFSRRHQEAGSIRIPEQDPPTWKRRMPTIQREKRSVSASLDVEENLGTTDKVRGQSRSHKPRGRPRTDDSQAPVLTAARRSQVRRAQRTYRLKKEATVRSYMARITSLEARIEEITDSLTELHDIAVRADLEQTHPALYTRLREICCNQAGKADAANLPSLPKTAVSNIAGIEDTAQVCNDDLSHQNLPIFGIVISNEYNDRSISVSPSSRHAQSQTSPMHRSIDGEEFLQTALLRLRDIERPLGQSIPIVNSFHEKDFVRRLHRSSLEHAYRLFLDNHSDPNVTYRMFRLVPVIRDKDRMSPYFQKLVQAGEAEPLEIDCLPFYSIGGAGTHYRRTDEFGLPIYPHNCRLPKRLLGIPPSIKSACKNTTSDEYQNHLRLFGLDGEWFDCQDVEGYLKHMGVALDQSSSFAEIYVTTPSTPTSHSLADGEQNRVSREGSNDTLSKDDGSVWKDLSLEVDDTSSGVNLTTTSLVMPRCVLDVENFVSILLKGLVILGRAPGFKRSSVEAAFLSSLTSVAYNTEED